MVAVTDRHSAYFAIDFLNNQVCLAHLLRNLEYLNDIDKNQRWAQEVKSLLREAIHERNEKPAERNFYKTIIRKLNVKDFGLSISSRIKTFVFKYISVAAKWIRTSRTYVLNIYTENPAYKIAFQQDFG